MRLLRWLPLFLLSSLASAQFTTVTGTVTDPNTVPYSNGNITAQLITAGTTPTLNGLPFSMSGSAGLDASGRFTMRLADNTQIVPNTLQWSFTVTCGTGCVPPAGGTGPQQFVVSITISGASQDISATLSAAAPALTRSGAATSVPFSGVTAGNNGNVLTTSNSISPSIAAAQIAGTQLWLNGGVQATSVSYTSLTGGSLNNTGLSAQIAYETALGETLPSVVFINSGTGACTGGNSCQATIVAPATLPSGVTGWTVFEGGSPPKKVASCINLAAGVNCVIGAHGAGGNPLTIATAWIQPPNAQASNGGAGTNFTGWFPKVDGNYYPWLGIDFNSCDASAGPPLPCGTPLITHRTFFSDTGNAIQAFKNAFVSINHTPGVGTVTTNQDRALGIMHSTVAGDTSTHYAIEGLQVEADINQTGAGFGITGSPDGEFTTASFQVGDTAAANWTRGGGFAANVIRATYFKNGVGTMNGGLGYTILNGAFSVGQGTFQAGSNATIVRASCPNATGVVVNNLFCYGMLMTYAPTAARYSSGTVALYASSPGLTPVAGSDFLLQNDVPGLGSDLNGPLTAQSLQTNNVASFPVTANIKVTGSVQSAATSGLGTTVGSCTGGASTYTYVFVGIDGNGGSFAASPANTAAQCVNPLTPGNPVTFNVSGLFAQRAIQAQFVRIDIYRTGGPMGTGKIGSLTCAAGFTASGFCSAFSDTGLAADGNAVPAVNTTGGTFAAGYSSLNGNKFFVTSNFTTAANTNLQTITGLVFNLLPAALNYEFHCALSYSQATANAAVAFGIQSSTIAPTNIFANGTEQITVGPPATFVTGTLATLNTTTATTIVSGTPGATATNYTVTLDGTIENPVSSTGNAVNIMVSTATAGDAVTVLRGSYCYLH